MPGSQAGYFFAHFQHTSTLETAIQPISPTVQHRHLNTKRSMLFIAKLYMYFNFLIFAFSNVSQYIHSHCSHRFHCSHDPCTYTYVHCGKPEISEASRGQRSLRTRASVTELGQACPVWSLPRDKIDFVVIVGVVALVLQCLHVASMAVSWHFYILINGSCFDSITVLQTRRPSKWSKCSNDVKLMGSPRNMRAPSAVCSCILLSSLHSHAFLSFPSCHISFNFIPNSSEFLPPHPILSILLNPSTYPIRPDHGRAEVAPLCAAAGPRLRCPVKTQPNARKQVKMRE